MFWTSIIPRAPGSAELGRKHMCDKECAPSPTAPPDLDLMSFVPLLFCDFIYIEYKTPTTSNADYATQGHQKQESVPLRHYLLYFSE